MKSTGNSASNSLLDCGYPSAVHERQPGSIQTSMTSGILVRTPPQAHFHFASSIQGLCRSLSLLPDLFSISFFVQTTSYSPHLSQRQTGSGVPQKRCLVMELSRKLESQESNALNAACGIQRMFLFAATICSLRSSTLKNHCFVVRNTTGLWQRQQGGDSCSTGATWTMAPVASSASTNLLSCTRAIRPANVPISGGNSAVSLMVFQIGNPSRWPT